MAMQGYKSSDASRQELQNTLLDTFKEAIDTAKPYWKKMGFMERTSSKAFEEVREYAGLGPAPEHEELAQLKPDVVKGGYISRINQTAYGVMMPVSQLALKFQQVQEAIDGAASIQESLVLCQELKHAKIFDDAFTVSNFIDGQSLCGSAHINPRGGTYSNLMAASSLNETAVEAMLIAAKKMPGGSGYATGVRLKRLMGPVEYEWKAKKVLKSELEPGSANNALNSIRGEGLDYTANPHLASTSNWYGGTDAKLGLQSIWVQKPTARMYENKERRADIFDGYQVFGTGCFNPRAILGNPL